MFFYHEQFFSYEEVNNLLREGLAIDGRQGGLVLGRSHDDGGIHFLVDWGYGYKLMGEMEGYEYLLNVALTHLLTSEDFANLNNHNRDYTDYFEEYDPTKDIRIIDTRLPLGTKYGAKFILTEGRGTQAIVNKYSTKKALQYIDEANKAYHTEYDGDSFYCDKMKNS